MAKRRFTDISKWRNEWFRTLPQKAKLAWIYLCDECDFCGIWKADYGLASFQLDFTLTNQMLQDWFGPKIHIFDGDNVLLLQFYEFQYGESKDSWTAKVKARERLETLGFSFVKNKIKVPQSPTVDPRSTSVLIEGVSVSVGVIDIEEGEFEGKHQASPETQLVEFWNSQDWILPKVSKLTKERKEKIKTRLSEASVEEWKIAITRIHLSDFLLGKGAKQTWKADFDWLIANEGNRLKIIEGKYDNKAGGSKDWDVMTVPLRGTS